MSILFRDDRTIEEAIRGPRGSRAFIEFDPSKHPRTRGGKFAEVLGKLRNAPFGSKVHLPNGVEIEHREGYHFLIRAPHTVDMKDHQGRVEYQGTEKVISSAHVGDVERAAMDIHDQVAARMEKSGGRHEFTKGEPEAQAVQDEYVAANSALMDAEKDKDAAKLAQARERMEKAKKALAALATRPKPGAKPATGVRQDPAESAAFEREAQRLARVAKKRAEEKQARGETLSERERYDLRNPMAGGDDPAAKFKPGDRVQHRDGGDQGKVSGDITNGRVPVKFAAGGSRDPDRVFMVEPHNLESLERPKPKKSKLSQRKGHDLLHEAASALAREVHQVFDAAKHPRGRHGQWVAKLGKLREYERLDLPGGGHITKVRAGYEVHAGEVGGARFGTPEAAAAAALPHIEAHTAKVDARWQDDQDRFEQHRIPGTNIAVHPRPVGSALSGQRTVPAAFQKGDKVTLADGREGIVMRQDYTRDGEEPSYAVSTTPPDVSPEMAEKHKDAFEAWSSGKAYLDNAGNYRIRGFNSSKGTVAPWNKEVKRDYPNNSDFHAAAGVAGRSYRSNYHEEKATHSSLAYAPDEQQARLEKVAKLANSPRYRSPSGPSDTSTGLLDDFLKMKFPTFGPSHRDVPDDWKVEHGFGEWVNPAQRNPAEGAEVGFMPGHKLHGKTGVVTRAGYYAGQKPGGAIPFRSGSLLFDVKVGNKTHTVTNQDVYDAELKPWVRLRPTAPTPEAMLYHYLVGHPVSNKFAPGTQGHAQFTYGLSKKEGGTGPVKKGDKEALLRKITQAVYAYRDGDLARASLLRESALELRAALGPLGDPALLVEGVA